MRRMIAVAALILFFANGSHGQSQTSNSLPVTAVTPPAPPALTTLGNLSPTGKIYTGSLMPINGSGFTASCVVNVDGTAQPVASFAFSSATLINFTIPASLGSASGTAHTVTVSCPLAQLTMNNPVILPNGKVGTAYTMDLGTSSGLKGGVPPYTFGLASGALPTNLTLSPSGIVSGTPGGAGSFTFDFTVKDSSGLALKRQKDTIKVGQVVAKK